MPLASLVTYGTFALVGIGLLASLFVDTRHPWSNPAPSPGTPATQASLAEGARLFKQNCAICHGDKGDGNGIAANVLDPKPRDFHVGKYRLVTSGNGVPFRADVIHSIQHGIPGTSMPAWMHLSDPRARVFGGLRDVRQPRQLEGNPSREALRQQQAEAGSAGETAE